MSIYDDMFEDGEGGERATSFPDVECLRATEKALLCRLKGGAERWVPLSQISPGSEVRAPGDVGELRVSEWFADRLDEDEKAESPKKPQGPSVSFADAVALRESDRAILVRIGDSEKEIWIPKTHVRPESVVKADGDVGDLVVSAWIAREKGLRG